MQGKSSKTQQVPPRTLSFSADLGQSKLQLFEVDESFLEEIFADAESGQAGDAVGHIKMPQVYNEESKRSACLSTQTQTFKLKSSETSNLMFATSLPGQSTQGQILLQANNFVEVTQTQRRDHQVLTLLRQKHSLST